MEPIEIKSLSINIAETEATVFYWMENNKPHVTRVVASDGRLLSKLSDTYSPSLELMVLLEEGIITEEHLR